uniref:Uncharacterized protein n=1 Tax=Rhizophora mucronata TaxID=61149 RepID=A0A2P2P2R4_RHIMU
MVILAWMCGLSKQLKFKCCICWMQAICIRACPAAFGPIFPILFWGS